MTNKEWQNLDSVKRKDWLLFFYENSPKVAEAVDREVSRLDKKTERED